MSTPPTQAPIADKARGFAPVVWLLGKVQSGKTSIIRELTQADSAEIGSGFRACTKTARVFDFPVEAPIIRFLDTRGLGEVAYDPKEDIGFCEGRSHLIEDFISKRGNKFAAHLVLSAKKDKAEFEFPPR